jgi:hypothetical protein
MNYLLDFRDWKASGLREVHGLGSGEGDLELVGEGRSGQAPKFSLFRIYAAMTTMRKGYPPAR